MKIGRVLLLALALAGCATARPKETGAPRRIPDSAPERTAANREAAKIGEPAAVEERFGAEAAKERREQEAARKDARQRRVDVIEGDRKNPK